MPRKRPSVYDHTWRKVRLAVLERDGYRCYKPGCPERATTADHIIPVSEAPHLRLDMSNLRASCGPHNFGRVQGRLAAMARINRMTAPVRAW